MSKPQPKVEEQPRITWHVSWVEDGVLEAFLNEIEARGDMVHDMWPVNADNAGEHGYEVVWIER